MFLRSSIGRRDSNSINSDSAQVTGPGGLNQEAVELILA